jgi:hypothetical protein
LVDQLAKRGRRRAVADNKTPLAYADADILSIGRGIDVKQYPLRSRAAGLLTNALRQSGSCWQIFSIE